MSEQKNKWDQARASFLAFIDVIDAETPWQEVEPQWWLEMMRVRRLLVEANFREAKRATD